MKERTTMDQNQLNSMSSLMSKLLRKNFGRGPQSCQSILNQRFFVMYIQGVISPMEEILIKQGQRKQVERARNVIINQVLEELKGALRIFVDKDIEHHYHDWNFSKNTGMVIFVFNNEMEDSDNSLDVNKLEREVARISEMVEKVPNKIHVYSLSPQVCLIERIGILTLIEQALVSKGYQEELRISKDELEKVYFSQHGSFDELFKKKVIDLFIDWNFDEDKSLMAFVLE
ncbi:Na-translocating system protein MpsC family protein [Litchfieldia alkalitelluris]|uniref:Na-translocating system protein MpsC family protein n=1 Tax=Litchfieldia alkalitelluris TaxID=304268 RepID=UPI0009968D15|nr:Na-translocating system protein MpsC family protein [Litchfieldia alkalitelluris]